MQSNRLPSLVRRFAQKKGVFLFIGLISMALLLGWQNGLGRLDRSLYDLFLATHFTPARDDIIIIAIDDYSIAKLVGSFDFNDSIRLLLNIDNLFDKTYYVSSYSAVWTMPGASRMVSLELQAKF